MLFYFKCAVEVIAFFSTFSHILKILMYIIIKKGSLDDLYIWIASNSFIVKLLFRF
ncbi:hypothetical protein RhiirA4_126939 [Rhizophagus irregularis]|uniref:Uncharacterized protein n=1 Tax=Rhizophagus irregularis TaxID=588596 RepID=A0A2I1HG70_9GLOM|nr:hypothetical protein RhiirA4_126939 [Rhizophagus irregularis]